MSGRSQSNGGSPAREPIRTGTFRSFSPFATRRPVLPVPPTTRVSFECVREFSHATSETAIRETHHSSEGSTSCPCVYDRAHGSTRRSLGRTEGTGRLRAALDHEPAVVGPGPGRSSALAGGDGAGRGVGGARRRATPCISAPATSSSRAVPSRTSSPTIRHPAAGRDPSGRALHDARRQGSRARRWISACARGATIPRLHDHAHRHLPRPRRDQSPAPGRAPRPGRAAAATCGTRHWFRCSASRS